MKRSSIFFLAALILTCLLSAIRLHCQTKTIHWCDGAIPYCTLEEIDPCEDSCSEILDDVTCKDCLRKLRGYVQEKTFSAVDGPVLDFKLWWWMDGELFAREHALAGVASTHKRPAWWALPGIAAVLIGANYADYLRQADDHGWPGLLWRRGARGRDWGVMDWIPHDPWHLAQVLSHAGWIYGSIALWEIFDPWPWYWRLLGVVAGNAVARGIGFSIPHNLVKK